MSLLFGANTTDKVNHGSASNLDNLSAGAMTVLSRVYRTATGNNQFVASKIGSWPAGWHLQLDDGAAVGDIACQVARATENAFRITSGAGNRLSLDTWYDIGFTWDSADSPTLRIYLVASGGLPVESSAYGGTSVNGAGAASSDASANLWVGNIEAFPTNPFKGRIELTGVFPSKLTPAQMQQWFANPGPSFGCVLAAVEGYAGTGTQPDLSGNGNSGTVTGATVADNAPLPRRWGRRVVSLPYTVAPPAGGNGSGYYLRRRRYVYY